MNKLIIWLFLACSTSMLIGQLNWNHTYFSGLMSDGTVYVRTQAEAGSTVSLLTKTPSGVQTTQMPNLNDGYNNHQVQIINPTYPYAGFRCITNNTTEVLPVFHNSTSVPAMNGLTPLFSDPVGDANFTFTNLDITGSYASFSNDKLYFAISNAGGGFPISSGFTYFAYLAALVNPDADSTANTIVYGLMQTLTIDGIISPGLYKITGTGISDMTLIGQITSTVYANANTIVLSCNLSDLMADADFSSWYNPLNPILGFIGMTNKITLISGSEVADQTASCNIIPQPILINQSPASIPLLTDIHTETLLGENATRITLNYFSPEYLLPVFAQIDFNTGFTSYFTPTAFSDFNQIVPYETIVDLDNAPNWSYASIRFSVDGIDFTDNMIYPTAINDFTDNSGFAIPVISIFPNPTRGSINLEITSTQPYYSIGLYDIRGRKLDSFDVDTHNNSDYFSHNINSLVGRPEGVYLIKVDFPDRSITRKVVFIK